MALTAYKIQEHVLQMEKLAQSILHHTSKIKQLQAECPHPIWRFHFQVNAFHNKLWNVLYKCDECSLVKTEKKPPVCEVCNISLVLDAGEEAEAERVKPEHQGYLNSPIAFRCPKCRKIHILRYEGD
jgi:hypothetical protein